MIQAIDNYYKWYAIIDNRTGFKLNQSLTLSSLNIIRINPYPRPKIYIFEIIGILRSCTDLSLVFKMRPNNLFCFILLHQAKKHSR
jgi:hypothetical protein